MDEQVELRRVIRWMWKRNRVRLIAEALLNDSPLPPDSVGTLRESIAVRTGFWQWRERWAAVRAMGRLAPANARTDIASLLRSILERRVERSPACVWMSCCLLNYMALPLLAGLWVVDRCHNRVRAEAARVLGILAQPESAQTLAAAAAGQLGQDREVRIASARALAHVLPLLPDQGLGSLPAQTVATLCRMLGDSRQEVVVDILRALRMAGTAEAIRWIEPLARHHRPSPIRSEAAETLAVLQARQREEKLRATLLRAATAPDAPAEVLLRPATSAGQAGDSQLLRPAAGDTEQSY